MSLPLQNIKTSFINIGNKILQSSHLALSIHPFTKQSGLWKSLKLPPLINAAKHFTPKDTDGFFFLFVIFQVVWGLLRTNHHAGLKCFWVHPQCSRWARFVLLEQHSERAVTTAGASSARPAVRPSVRPSVRLSIHPNECEPFILNRCIGGEKWQSETYEIQRVMRDSWCSKVEMWKNCSFFFSDLWGFVSFGSEYDGIRLHKSPSHLATTHRRYGTYC